MADRVRAVRGRWTCRHLREWGRQCAEGGACWVCGACLLSGPDVVALCALADEMTRCFGGGLGYLTQAQQPCCPQGVVTLSARCTAMPVLARAAASSRTATAPPQIRPPTHRSAPAPPAGCPPALPRSRHAAARGSRLAAQSRAPPGATPAWSAAAGGQSLLPRTLEHPPRCLPASPCCSSWQRAPSVCCPRRFPPRGVPPPSPCCPMWPSTPGAPRRGPGDGRTRLWEPIRRPLAEEAAVLSTGGHSYTATQLGGGAPIEFAFAVLHGAVRKRDEALATRVATRITPAVSATDTLPAAPCS